MKPFSSRLARLALLSCFSLPALAADDLDLSQVRKIVFVGDGSAIELSTDAGRPYRLQQERSWPFRDYCQVTQSLSQNVLTLGVKVNGSYPLSHCKVTFRANLPASRQVEILQGANSVDAQGLYDRFTLNSGASQIKFRGGANLLTLKGSALKADARLTGAQPRGKVVVDGRLASVYLAIERRAAVDYLLQGAMSSFDRGWRNQPGAPLRVEVNGEYIQATLAYL